MTDAEKAHVESAATAYKNASEWLVVAARDLASAAAEAEIATGNGYIPGTTRSQATLARHAESAKKAAKIADELQLTSHILKHHGDREEY